MTDDVSGEMPVLPEGAHPIDIPQQEWARDYRAGIQTGDVPDAYGLLADARHHAQAVLPPSVAAERERIIAFIRCEARRIEDEMTDYAADAICVLRFRDLADELEGWSA